MKNEIYLRELKWTEQFSAAMQVFSAVFGPIGRVLLFLFLPVSLLESVLMNRMLSLNLALQQLMPAPEMIQAGGQGAVSAAQQSLPLLMQLLSQELLLFAVTLFLQPVGIVAIAKIVKQYLDGEEIQVGRCISEALGCMPAILISGFLFGVLVLFGSFFIVPGVYFGIAWGFYHYCIALEGKKGWDALRSSAALVRGKWWKTFGYLFLLGAVGIIWNSVFEVICSFIGNAVIAEGLYHFLCYFSISFVAVGEVLLYLNRKAMAEGDFVFRTVFVEETADAPAEPVEGTVEGEGTSADAEEKKEKENN
ncbi:MAG: hypothetical protein Q4C06_03300 [Bacillota bacterium]|nr:hypothetical protein [Bacillota bacterium]